MTPVNSLTQATTGNTDFTATKFMIDQIISKIETSMVVKVISCTNNDENLAVGYVDIQPLINMVDGLGNGFEHGILYNVPYVRIQGGGNAVIIDPKPNDIGIAVFCSRDISEVKLTKSVSNPNSYRRYDISDGLYIGGILNNAPQQYIQFKNDGIYIFSPNNVILNANVVNINAVSDVNITSPNITINGKFTVNGDIEQNSGISTFNGNVVINGQATSNGISLSSHVHSGVQSGGNNTGVPVS